MGKSETIALRASAALFASVLPASDGFLISLDQAFNQGVCPEVLKTLSRAQMTRALTAPAGAIDDQVNKFAEALRWALETVTAANVEQTVFQHLPWVRLAATNLEPIDRS